MGILILIVGIFRIVWGLVKGVFLALALYHLFASLLFYPTINSDGISVSSIVTWLSVFVEENWMYLVGLFVLYYSWTTARKVRSMEERLQQVEVISFAQTKYFRFWPETDIVKNSASSSELAKSYIVGFLFSIFNLNNPKDLPWSARPIRDGEEVSIFGDVINRETTDV